MIHNSSSFGAHPITSELFENANEEPMIDPAVLGDTWSQMKAWATLCGIKDDPIAPGIAEMLEIEEQESGDGGFCCYGTVSSCLHSRLSATGRCISIVYNANVH